MSLVSKLNSIKRRLTKRNSFLKKIPKNGVGAELGVFLGELSVDILKMTGSKKVYFVDPYYLIQEYYGDWANVYNNGQKLSTLKASEIALEKISHFNNYEFLIKDDIEFLESINENYLDWVYIDSSHQYDHTVKELELCRVKVKNGGVISGHDYIDMPDHRHYGVCKAVKEFCKKYNLKVVFVDAHSQWLIYNEK